MMAATPKARVVKLGLGRGRASGCAFRGRIVRRRSHLENRAGEFRLSLETEALSEMPAPKLLFRMRFPHFLEGMLLISEV
jgi:hypothetical protein